MREVKVGGREAEKVNISESELHYENREDDPSRDEDEEQEINENTRRMHPFYHDSECDNDGTKNDDVDKLENGEEFSLKDSTTLGNKVVDDETEVSRIPESIVSEDSKLPDTEVTETIISESPGGITLIGIKEMAKVQNNNLVADWRSVNGSTSMSDSGFNKSGELEVSGNSSMDFESTQKENGSVQGSICNILDRMNMGLKRGRPRTKAKSYVNPFDIRMKRKVISKGRKIDKVVSQRKGRLKVFSETDTSLVSQKKQGDHRKQAEDIAEMAIQFGWEFNQGRENGVLEIEKRLVEETL